MDAKKVILGSLEQSWGFLTKALDGLTQKEFAFTPGPECNSIAFILWHTARVEDFFVNRIIKREKELYTTGGWQAKLGTPDKLYQLTPEELQAWQGRMGIDATQPPAVRLDSVESIQQALIALGGDLGPAGADGKWGARSKEALMHFQTEHGLQVDGIAGPVTLAALRAAIPRV